MKRPSDLTVRRAVEICLPEFLVRALELRVDETNVGASPDERCTLDHLVEAELAGLITVRDLIDLEARIPGITDAVNAWLNECRE